MLEAVLDAYLSCNQFYDASFHQLKASIWKIVEKVYNYSFLQEKIVPPTNSLLQK